MKTISLLILVLFSIVSSVSDAAAAHSFSLFDSVSINLVETIVKNNNPI